MIRDFFSRMMYGRYGNDQLNIFLLTAWLMLYLLSAVFKTIKLALLSRILLWVAYACVVIELLRMLSRNYDKRRRENDRFVEITGPVTHGFRQKRAQMMDKDHRYFRCPSCGQVLRVPKGKGKIHIRCRNCGSAFQKKT
ncbi:MAG: hypothetical protein MJ077_03080 [Oscillospiraceae bacterium]|nr:hypothetical protein [Oscillospiraceae bacterium]